MAEVTGHVQYRFRSDEQDTNILLRGESEWVRQKVEELGLTGLGSVSYTHLTLPTNREV